MGSTYEKIELYRKNHPRGVRGIKPKPIPRPKPKYLETDIDSVNGRGCTRDTLPTIEEGRTLDTNDTKDTNDEPFITKSKRLRTWLKFYLYSEVKLQGNTCSIHPVYSILLLVQIVKIILISVQMIHFGYDRGNFSELVNRGHLTLRHQLLENWDSSWETLAYPPARGDFAVYKIDDLESGINYAVEGYYNAEELAIGFFNRTINDKMQIHVKYFDFPGFKDTDVKEGVIIKDKTFPTNVGLSKGKQLYEYDVIKEFTVQNLKQPMKRLLSTELRFSIHSVRVYEIVRQARCLHVKGWVTFNDLDNNGQTIVNLETLTRRIKCGKLNLTLQDWALENTSETLGGVLIFFCFLSLVASTTFIILAIFLFVKTKQFMKKYYRKYFMPLDDEEKDLPVSEYWRFVNFWEISVVLSDICTLYGTIWIVFENQDSEWIVEMLDSYTVWLGVGCIFAWISLLRFFKFHNKFHLLFRTLYRASGNVIAYLICVSVLFTGFWMAGFVVLSPYHVKFRTPTAAAETLFSMVNGDEIYTTLAILESEKIGGKWVWWFARFYIGAYISIFTIVVINLLVAIYMSAYESIKNYYSERPNDREVGAMEKALRKYLSEQKDQNNPIRSSICSLLIDNRQFSRAEGSLRTEMQKIVRVKDQTVILIKPRTLRAFMKDEPDTSTVIKCGCINFAFLTFFKLHK